VSFNLSFTGNHDFDYGMLTVLLPIECDDQVSARRGLSPLMQVDEGQCLRT
jgi:hypothetical protein